LSALFGVGAGIPCSGEKFPAYSLLGAKNSLLAPRREFCLKALKSKAFSAPIFPKEAEFPAVSLLSREFSLLATPYPASNRRSAFASSTTRSG